MIGIAILFCRGGRYVYDDVVSVEYRRYGLRLGGIIIHVFQFGAMEKGIFAYAAYLGRNAYLLQAWAIPENPSADAVERSRQFYTSQLVAAGKGIEFQAFFL